MQPTPETQKMAPFPYMRSGGNGEPVASTYFVYKDARTHVRVQAVTAGEAIVKSNVTNPFKIKRYDPLSQVLLNTSDLGITIAIEEEEAPKIAANESSEAEAEATSGDATQSEETAEPEASITEADTPTEQA